MKLLDIGCGEGDYTILEACRYKPDELYGVDYNLELLSYAEEKGIQTANVDIDKNNLPYQDCFFDIIYSRGLIEILDNPDKLFIEAKRVLKNGGVFIIETPNLCWWANRIAILFGYLPYSYQVSREYIVGKFLLKPRKYDCQWPLPRFHCVRSMRQLAELHGFTKVEIGYTGIIPKIPSLARWVRYRLWK